MLLFPFRLLRPRTLIVLSAVLMAATTSVFVQRYVDRAELQQQARALAAREAAGERLAGQDSETLKEWRKLVDTVAVPVAKSKDKQKQMEEEQAWRLGPLPAYARGIWAEWLTMFQPNPFWPIMAEIAGTMLLGMALFKLGFIQGQLGTSIYLAVLLVGYGLGIPLRLVGTFEQLAFHAQPKLGWLFYDSSRIAMTLGHIAAVHLLLRSVAGRALLAPFAASGRMPLTIYLSASFVCMWLLFPAFGLSLFGRFGNGGLMLIAIAIIAAQTLAANLWLRRYETGPLEWVWKSLAYGQRQPFRRPLPAQVPPLTVPAE
jgi:uncharacterized protein